MVSSSAGNATPAATPDTPVLPPGTPATPLPLLGEEHPRSLPPSPEEKAAIAALRQELAAELAAQPQHPELVGDWKLLRFLRGYGGKLPAAAQAYRAMLAYRAERDVERVRRVMAAFPPEEMPWPYYLPQFAPLIERVWNGRPPAVHHRTHPDNFGDEVTITVFKSYSFDRIISEGFSELWLEMALHCDVYFDLLLQARSDAAGRPVARHDIVDCEGIGLTSLGPSALQLVKRMGESGQHYPEMISRTSAVNFGAVGLALWKVAKPFLPRQTAEKFAAEGESYDLSPQVAPAWLPHRLRGSCCCDVCALIARHTRECSVPAGRERSFDVPVPKGAQAAWAVSLQAYDVDLTVEFAPSDGAAPSVLHAKARTAAGAQGKGKASGALAPVPAAGVLRLSFDNSHSRMRAKSVEWSVTWQC